MEYTFRNSPGESATTVLLTEHGITVKQGHDEYSVPYIGITMVNIDKLTSKVFHAIVMIEGHRPLVITNRYYIDNHTVEDRSRAYSTFIRVMHYHLKDKSKASFASGSAASRLRLQIITAAAVAFVISFVAEYAGLSLLNPFVQGAVLATALALLILVRYVNHWPRSYNPTDIPMRFLP